MTHSTDFSLIQSLQESINDKGRLKAVFVCGIPGAGKTYTISAVNDPTINPRIVNSDKMFEFLGKTGRADIGSKSGWDAAADTVERTTKSQLAQYINSMLPLFVDSTSSNPSTLIRRKGLLEAFGYDVGLLWINTDVEVAIKRAAQRDRHVSEQFIRDTYERSIESKPFIQSRFEWNMEINNSDGELSSNAIAAAYKACGNFFTRPLQNVIGTRAIRQLSTESEKYLVPSIYSLNEINHLANVWYKH